ncbi:MAG: hypothetical protein ACRENJ_11735, partial [Candidatus Eiseniibacteriota bacterium]
MRRLSAMLVVAAACGTVFSVGALMGRSCTSFAERNPPVSWLMLAHAPALAQEVMQFRRVPAESVSVREGRRNGRGGTPPAPPEASPI